MLLLQSRLTTTGAKAMIVTKLRIGDANTMMAEGGIQAADKPNDSPCYSLSWTHSAAVTSRQSPSCSNKLVNDAPDAIKWLTDLGVEFDKAPDGTMITTHGGGTSRKRMHAAKDYSGAEIMRTLRDEVLNRGIPVVDFTSAVELILDENGKCCRRGPHEHGDKRASRSTRKDASSSQQAAQDRLHYQGFPTSNHYGATADGLILGYQSRRKAPLCRYTPVPPDRRGLSGTDLRRARNGKGTFSRCKARQRKRRSIHAPA